MNIPERARRKIVSNVKLNPHEVGTLLRAVISCLDSVDSLKDERYRATLLVLRDRLVKSRKSRWASSSFKAGN
jgi:hypothetical protein